jgi:site-specific DNA recombinase
LEAQAGRLNAYVTSQGNWKLVRSFTDQVSGATLERPGLARALTEARAHQFDLLLVYRVDRLARSVRGLAQILEELDQAGVAFRSATEPFDTSTPAGRMMVQMLGVFAEFERATIIDRVIAGMERKAARGEWCVGPPPYGYDVEKSLLKVNEAEAAIVPLIFELYALKRLGTRAVANWLNEAGHRSRSGRLWSHVSVGTVLRNRTYLGEIYFRGQWHPASHAPLVDSTLFAAANAIITERGTDISTRASASSDYLLTGLVVCGQCGKHFTRQRSARALCTLPVLHLPEPSSLRNVNKLHRSAPPG